MARSRGDSSSSRRKSAHSPIGSAATCAMERPPSVTARLIGLSRLPAHAVKRLDEVLDGADLTAGDFVRRCKQIVDLLDQVGDAAPQPELRSVARQAVDRVMRGVVAADRLD